MVKKGKEKAAPAAPAAPSAASKKPAKAPKAKPPKEDDFIVFTNSDKEIKPKRAKPPPTEAEQAGPPKPTVKQIVGGSSWTGKLPVNLLSEHCQKQKWDKPSYDNVRIPKNGVLGKFRCCRIVNILMLCPR